MYRIIHIRIDIYFTHDLPPPSFLWRIVTPSRWGITVDTVLHTVYADNKCHIIRQAFSPRILPKALCVYMMFQTMPEWLIVYHQVLVENVDLHEQYLDCQLLLRSHNPHVYHFDQNTRLPDGLYTNIPGHRNQIHSA